MTPLELLQRVRESKAWGHLDSGLMAEIEAHLKTPPTIINVLLRGTQVISVSGPFEAREADQYARIAAAVGGVRVTSMRLAVPPTKSLDKAKPHHDNWK